MLCWKLLAMPQVLQLERHQESNGMRSFVIPILTLTSFVVCFSTPKAKRLCNWDELQLAWYIPPPWNEIIMGDDGSLLEGWSTAWNVPNQVLNANGVLKQDSMPQNPIISLVKYFVLERLRCVEPSRRCGFIKYPRARCMGAGIPDRNTAPHAKLEALYAAMTCVDVC